MSIIQYHEGCGTFETGRRCMGPSNYWTVFGITKEVWICIGVSILLGLIAFGILSFLKKKDKLQISLRKIIIFSIFVALLFFIGFFFAFLNVIY